MFYLLYEMFNIVTVVVGGIFVIYIYMFSDSVQLKTIKKTIVIFGILIIITSIFAILDILQKGGVL